MKSFVVFACVILGAWAANILVVEEQKLHHLHDQCQADPATHADHELLHHLSENIDNPQVGAHMLCESKAVGLQSENGELDLDTIKSKVALSVNDDKEVDRLVKECAIKKNSAEKTAIHLFMCLDKNGAASQLDLEEKELHEIHDRCQSDPATYVDHELLHHLADNIDNPQVGAHMLCESKAVGLQKPNGELDLKVIRHKISLSVSDKDKVDRLVRECAVKKDIPEKTAVNLFMCLDKDGVTYFHEF
ncbi:hypothetical protein NQ315_006929 [Exocentrus adspersus]|uniref:Uncharacterized protein n=1 Tax=Exocentrus adspersus TaxID=1586481 RepID=A0AAV8WBW7_9CUCU|nr:hypothetical protein NQ315_006929 [Exocentrus adspersus]